MRFNGSTSIITNTTANVVGSSDKISFIAWLRPLTSGGGGQARILVLDEAANSFSMLLGGGGTVMQCAKVYSGGTANWGVSNSTSIWEFGKWCCVSVTLDASAAANDAVFHISKAGTDGGLIPRALGTDTNSTGTPTAPNTGFSIGNRADTTRSFDGDICFMQVFNRILTQAEQNVCAYRPGLMKKDRAIYAPLINHPWIFDANGKAFTSTTCTAVTKGGSPPGVVAYHDRKIYGKVPSVGAAGNPWYYYANQ